MKSSGMYATVGAGPAQGEAATSEIAADKRRNLDVDGIVMIPDIFLVEED